jgi:LysM repeat protein
VANRKFWKNDLGRHFFEGKRRRDKEMNHRLKAIEPTRPAPTTNTMNNPNPLIPQGSLLEQKAKSRPHLRIAIAIVAVHLVFLGGLLIQGCGKEDPIAKASQATNESPMPPLTNSNPYNPSLEAQPANELAHTSAPVVPSLPTPSPGQLPAFDQAVPGATREYVVISRDNFTTIGKKFGVSSGAIAKANPGVDSTRLQVGQKLVIPPAPSPSVATATVGSGSENSYLVKTGDTLLKIATANGTTVKEIKALNGLTTDRIKAGDKLKLPAKSAPATPNSTATNPGTPATPPPGTSNL